MRDVTLCFLLESERICLAQKKRGFGEGKLNGYGGKVGEGETIESATVRELEEEAGVLITPESLEKVAVIEFSFEGKPDWSQRMHVFFVRTWAHDPVETEEMAPVWTKLDAIPYDAMWIDDKYWLPRALAGETLEGIFGFNADGSEVLINKLRAL